MKHISLFHMAALILGLPGQLTAQTIQYQLDTLSTSGNLISGGAALTDGSTAVLMGSQGAHVIWKANAQGTPQWARQCATLGNNPQLVKAANSGVYLLDPSSPVVDAYNSMFDSAHMVIDLVKFDGDGTVLWSRAMHVSALVPPESIGTSERCKLTEDENANVFLSLTMNIGTYHAVLFLIKLDPSGSMLWCKRIGASDNMYGVIAAYPDYPGEGVAYEPGLGGAGYLFMNTGWSPIRALGVNADGDVTFNRAYDYQNNYLSFAATGSGQQNGNLLLTGRLDIPMQDYGHLMRIAANGDLVSMDIYPTLGPAAFGSPIRMANGHLLIPTNVAVAEIDDAGDVINAPSLEGMVAGENIVGVGRMVVGHEQGLTKLINSVTTTHQIFGYITRYAQVWSFPEEQADGCLMSTQSFDHYAVPNNLVSTADISGWISENAVLSIGPGLAAVPIAPVGTLDACSLVQSVPTDVLGSSSPFSLERNTVTVGGAFTVHAVRGGHIDMIDANGRLVRAPFPVVAGSTYQIGTEGLANGLYSLRYRSTGTGVSSKVLVMP